jgi:hypothetical protein
LVHPRDLINLTTLYLGGTSVTDAGLVHLRSPLGLRTLNLAGTAITDTGLAHVRGLTGLRKLVLWGTCVTDVGLVHLRTLAGLRELDLERTQVSAAGVEDLRQALLEVEIVGLESDDPDAPSSEGRSAAHREISGISRANNGLWSVRGPSDVRGEETIRSNIMLVIIRSRLHRNWHDRNRAMGIVTSVKRPVYSAAADTR